LRLTHLSEENMADTPSDQPAIGRRNFLKGVTLGGAAALAGTEARALPAPPKAIAATLPGPKLIAAETIPPDPDPVLQSSSGGDFMVDVLKTLDIDYLAVTCGSTFRGLHEAVVNYGNNTKPEVITCNHEEIGVAMAHGYAKMEGKPMAAACHGTVGLQHATMANVQRLVRPCAGLRHDRQYPRSRQAFRAPVPNGHTPPSIPHSSFVISPNGTISR
jgi:hypothetical protein